jgi:hypothetical protein
MADSNCSPASRPIHTAKRDYDPSLEPPYSVSALLTFMIELNRAGEPIGTLDMRTLKLMGKSIAIAREEVANGIRILAECVADSGASEIVVNSAEFIQLMGFLSDLSVGLERIAAEGGEAAACPPGPFTHIQ